MHPKIKKRVLTIRVSSRLVGSGAGGALFDASKRAASRPELGLAAVTPRLFSFRCWGVSANEVVLRTGG
jgi:hypothetical protein